MKLNSNLVKGLEIPVSAELIWPRLVRNDIINFPLTYIGNSSVSELLWLLLWLLCICMYRVMFICSILNHEMFIQTRPPTVKFSWYPVSLANSFMLLFRSWVSHSESWLLFPIDRQTGGFSLWLLLLEHQKILSSHGKRTTLIVHARF